MGILEYVSLGNGASTEREVTYLTEGAFYRIVGQRQAARIKNPAIREAVEQYQDWVFSDVLPTLRKEGVKVDDNPTRVSDDEIRAAVERQLEKRQYKNVIRDTIGNLKHSNRRMYSDIRDRFLVKVSGMKSRELINSGRPIRTWAGSDGPKPRDYNTGTNYLTAEELDNFNLILDYVALELRRKQPKTYNELLKICSEAVHKAGV